MNFHWLKFLARTDGRTAALLEVLADLKISCVPDADQAEEAARADAEHRK